MLGPDGRCFGLVDSWLVGRGEGDGLGEEEASRQKGAEGAVKDGGGWKMQKRGAEGAPNEKSAPKAPKNEKIGAEGAEKGRGGGGGGLSTVVCPFVMILMGFFCILLEITGDHAKLLEIYGNY